MSRGRWAVNHELYLDSDNPAAGGLWLPRAPTDERTAIQLAELATLPRSEFDAAMLSSKASRMSSAETEPPAPRRFSDMAQVFQQLQQLAVTVKTTFPPPVSTPRLVGQLWHATHIA